MKPTDMIRQPLLHFFALGAVLFVLFRVVNGDTVANPGDIVVDGERIGALVTRFERTWQRPPTRQELEGLVESWIREEVLYREGLALSLDRDDPVVRRRVAQKFEFMFEGTGAAPGEAELRDWLEAHAERYRVPPRYAFDQLYFNPEQHGDRLPVVVEEALTALAAGADTVTGDLTLLPGRVPLSSAADIERSFGAEFASSLAVQATGRWVGPVRSSYGVHLVRVERSEAGYLPELDAVRNAVERDLLQERSERLKDEFYRALRDRYNVRIETAPDPATGPGPD